MKLVTAAQMSAIEQSSVEAGVSLDALMENAGLAVAGTRDPRSDQPLEPNKTKQVKEYK